MSGPQNYDLPFMSRVVGSFEIPEGGPVGTEPWVTIAVDLGSAPLISATQDIGNKNNNTRGSFLGTVISICKLLGKSLL